MKNRTKIYLSLITLTTLSISALSGVASAFTKAGFFKSTVQVQARQVQTFQRPGTSRFQAAINRHDVVSVEAGATGDGPATDEDCKQFAQGINAQLVKMDEAWYDDDFAAAYQHNEAAENQIDMAEDAGCFVIY